MLGIAELNECFLALEPVEYLASNHRWQKMLIRGLGPKWVKGSWQTEAHLIPIREMKPALEGQTRRQLIPVGDEIILTSMKDEKQGYSFPLLRRSEEVTQESTEGGRC